MKLKKMLTVLCVVVLLATLLTVSASAVDPQPFSATFNGYAGVTTIDWVGTITNKTQNALINVTGYNAASGNTSVGMTSIRGGTSIYVVFYTTGLQLPQYPTLPRENATATLRISASTGIIGVGGEWRP